MISLPKSVGTIGAGNMAEAILRGLLRAGMAPEQLVASDLDAARREEVAAELGIRTTDSNGDVAQAAEVVVLAVKPAHLEVATQGLAQDGGPVFVSIVAGKTAAFTLGDGPGGSTANTRVSGRKMVWSMPSQAKGE